MSTPVVLATLAVYGRLGGEARYAQRLAEHLPAGSIVISLWDDPVHGALAPAHIRFVACSSRKVRFALRVLRHARGARHVVLGHVLLTPLAPAARALGAGVAMLAYGLEVWQRPGFIRRALVDTSVARVIAISRTTADRMARAYRLPASRFRLLPPAVDEPVPGPHQPRATELLMVTRLGDHTGDKGADLAVRAMPRVLRAVPRAVLRIVGEGPGRAHLRALADALGVGHAVALPGALTRDELERAYASASAFVLPSAQEGFGIVFLEAWRHALPVVGVAAGAAPEVVGEHGVLVPPGDVPALADALIGVLTDPETARALGESGRAEVARRYTAGAFGRSLEEALGVNA